MPASDAISRYMQGEDITPGYCSPHRYPLNSTERDRMGHPRLSRPPALNGPPVRFATLVFVAEPRHLVRPPIKEAVITIEISPELPAEFVPKIDKEWPECGKRQPIRRGLFQFRLNDPLSSFGSQEQIGIRCDSEDGRSVTQIRRNGIAFSIVNEYRDWEELESRTLSVWKNFLGFANSPQAFRVATRFINVLRLPGNIEFDDYLTAAPRVPDGLPQILGGFSQRVIVPMRQDLVAVIIQVLDAPTPDAISVILDIDVQLSCGSRGNEGDIRTLINSLRKAKNDVFFSSVTEKALEGY